METISKNDQGHLLLSGVLNYQTVPDIHNAAQKLLPKQAPWVVDLQSVTYSNSAGLALLLEWFRMAQLQQQRFCIKNLPPQLLAIAQVTGISKLLPFDEGDE